MVTWTRMLVLDMVRSGRIPTASWKVKVEADRVSWGIWIKKDGRQTGTRGMKVLSTKMGGKFSKEVHFGQVKFKIPLDI